MIERFQYHAFATGLGGHITLPFDEIIQVQAAAALPESGGFGSSRVENFRFRDIVSFTSATAVVAGSYSEKDKTWDSLAMVTIDGLNILSTVTADRVVARIYTSHPDDRNQQPSVTPVGSYFENLRIAGYPVEAPLDTPTFAQLDTFNKVCEAYDRDAGEFREKFRLANPREHNSTGCSLLPLIQSGPLVAWQKERGVFSVPGFGVIRLVQFQLKPRERRITMIQMDLGSTPKGNMSVATGEGNGSHWP